MKKIFKSNVFQRIILCLIAIPIVVSLCLFYPEYGYASLCFVLFGLCVLGTYEIKAMMFARIDEPPCPHRPLLVREKFIYERMKGFYTLRILGNTPLVPDFLPAFLIVTSYVDSYYFKGRLIATSFFALFLILYITISEMIIGPKDDFTGTSHRTLKTLFMVCYPSTLMTFAPIILNKYRSGGLLILLMLILIFANDSFCYVGGKLLGKNNKGFIKASPSKSIAGFVSGIIFTFLIGWGFITLFPSTFRVFIDKLWLFAIFTTYIAILADIGDLLESIIKRAARVKDSGNIMLGRGGVLDSIDSIIFTLPFFYVFLELSNLFIKN